MAFSHVYNFLNKKLSVLFSTNEFATAVTDLIPSSAAHILVTYAELAALKASSSLIVDQEYQITDYATTYIMPVALTPYVGATEAIVVTAISSNSFSEEAYSLSYPQDILYYSFTNSIVTTTLKGFIYRRIDNINNVSVPFDFRNVKFRRYKVDLTSAGMTNDYFSWSNAVFTISYNIATNAAFSFTPDALDFVDYLAIPTTAKNVNIANNYQVAAGGTWSPAYYNFVFNSTAINNIELGDYSFNFTVKATSITYIIGGNLNTAIWLTDGIYSQWIKKGAYEALQNALIYYTTGASCQNINFDNCTGLYLKGQRFDRSKFTNCINFSNIINRGRDGRFSYLNNFGIGTGSDTIEGVSIESMGGNSISGYGGYNLNVYTGADLGLTGTSYLTMGNGFSNLPISYVITGLTTLVYTATRDLVGKAILTSTNATENINAFTNTPRSQNWRVYPASGLTLTITASATIKLGNGVATIVLNGTNGDYAEFKGNGTVGYLVNHKIY